MARHTHLLPLRLTRVLNVSYNGSNHITNFCYHTCLSSIFKYLFFLKQQFQFLFFSDAINLNYFSGVTFNYFFFSDTTKLISMELML